jgi:DHA3 family macrolide efflux protein-like MFS transporter
MAIIWHLTNTTGSAMVLSLATMAGFLPQAILGTMIGVLVDRWNRKLVMIGADIIIAVAALALTILSLTMELPVWVALVVLFIRSIGTAFHFPALSAATPLLVPENQLTRCAGYSQSIQSVSYILSPAIAAFLYTQWGLNAAVALDIFGALAACVTIALVSIPKQTLTQTSQNHFFTELREGYHVARKNRPLFALIWIGAFYTFLYMPVNALFPLMSMEYFGGTTTHASGVEISFAAGMLLGGLLLGMWGGFKNRMTSILGSIAVMGAVLTLSGLLPPSGYLIFVLCCAFMGFSAPFYSGVQMALFQEQIPPEYLGRVFGLLGSIISLAMPLGLIVSGVFADQIGVHRWFALSGIGILTMALLAACLPQFRKLGR